MATFSPLTLSKCVDSLMVIANSNLMMNHLNKIAFIAAHSNASHFLYLKKTSDGVEAVNDGELNDGKYEMFDRLNYLVKEEIKDLVLNSMKVEFENDSLIAGAVSMALCYIHRMEKEAQLGVKISSRIILVVKASEDNPAKYMNFMNAIFSAQKLNIVIDACILDNDSGLLQEILVKIKPMEVNSVLQKLNMACDITGGVYLKIPQPQGLLQYLLTYISATILYRGKLYIDLGLSSLNYIQNKCNTKTDEEEVKGESIIKLI